MPSSPLTVPAPHALALSELVAGLGAGLAAVVDSRVAGGSASEPARDEAPPDPLIDDVTLAEPGVGLTGVPGDLVLGVGIATAGEAEALVTAAATAGAGALALRRGLAREDQVRAAAGSAGLPLVAVADEASWAHVAWLVRELLDRALTSTSTSERASPDELFVLADACAALVGGPVTIEDTSSRVLAYSASTDPVDPARVSTIVGRRVPAATVAALRARGVFRHLVRSAEPLFLPAAADGSLDARFVVPIRVGDEWIGSIWAIVDAPVPESVHRALRDIAAVVALQLLRLRTAADLGRQLVSERLQSVLAGDASASADLALPAPPWRVVVLGSDPSASPAGRLAHWESVFRRASWQRPLLVLLDDDVLTLVAEREPTRPARELTGPERQSWRWLSDLVGGLARQRPWAWAAASGPVHAAAELPPALTTAREVARLVAAGELSGPTVPAEEAWAALIVARAVRAVASDLAGPAPVGGAGPVLLGGAGPHEGFDPVLAQTVRAWLDHPGDLKASAAALSVHVNTVRYRLARARAELGLDLNDPTVRLALALHLRALPTAGAGHE